MITADEGDHFVGGPPSPANCNGVTVLCHYKKVGEVDGNLTGMLAAKGITTPFDVEADSAPAIYVHGQPARTAPSVRAMERATAPLSALDLSTGRTVRLTRYLADPVELGLLHMVTGDPKRTPSFIQFANPDFWLSSGSGELRHLLRQRAARRRRLEPRRRPPADQHHLAGHGRPRRTAPGRGQLDLVRPHRHPAHDDGAARAARRLRPGRPGAHRGARRTRPCRPRCARTTPAMLRLGQVYSQIEAAVGAFGLDTLQASTRALASNSPGDKTYTRIESQLQRLGTARDALAARMRADLLGAAFYGRQVSGSQARSLIAQGERLLGEAAVLAG